MIYRRHFLVASFSAVFLWPNLSQNRPGPLRQSLDDADWITVEGLLAVFSSLGPPRRLGKLYLQDYPHEADPKTLFASIMDRTDTLPLPALRGFLRTRLRDDFARGKVVILDGWVLARTEARLYGLVAAIENLRA